MYEEPFSNFRDVLIALTTIGVVLCITFIGVMNEEVDIHVCKSNSITTYVGVKKPNKILSFGDCSAFRAKKRVYFALRNEMSRSTAQY